MKKRIQIVITDTRLEITADPIHRLPVDLYSDGTLWVNPKYPLVITKHLPNAKELIEKYSAALKAGNLPKVADPAHIARLGLNGPMLVEEAGEYADRTRAARHAKYRAEEAARAALPVVEMIKVHVSTRGWGDYSCIYWSGPADKPTTEIMAECRQLMARAHDVDHRNQTDEELAARIEEARAELAQKKAAKAAKEGKIEEAKAKAKEIGEKIKIRSWVEDCDESVSECSTDILTEWATPDGRIIKTRTHTF